MTTLITTRPVSRIACDTARLRGTVRAGAAASRYWFQFGTTRQYGRTTADGRTGRGAKVVAVHAQAVRLLPDTTYHYRLVSVRADGRRTYGANRSFGTSGPRACVTQVETRQPRTPQGFTG